MEIARQSATLDRDEYRRALELLEHEREEMQLSRWHRLAYGLLNVSVYGCLLFLVVMIAANIAGEMLPAWSGQLTLAAGGAFILSIILGFASPLALLLNLPLVLKIWRKGRVLRSLGLTDFFQAEFARSPKDSRWREGLAVGLSGFGLLLIVGGLVLLIPSLNQLGTLGETDGGRAAFMGLLLIAAGLSMLSSYFIRRGRRHLKLVTEVRRLQSQLESYSATESNAEPDYEPEAEPEQQNVTIPYEILTKLGNVERQQISRERQQTILMSARQQTPDELPFFVQKSRTAREAIDALPIETQLLVDDALDGLAQDPYPEGAAEAAPGSFVWDPKGSSVQLAYAVDDAARQIRLLRLEQRDENQT